MNIILILIISTDGNLRVPKIVIRFRIGTFNCMVHVKNMQYFRKKIVFGKQVVFEKSDYGLEKVNSNKINKILYFNSIYSFSDVLNLNLIKNFFDVIKYKFEFI